MRRALLTMIVIGLVAVGAVIDWKRISIDGLQGALNDQVGYIAVARHWANGDGLRSSFVYPSLLRQNVTKSTFYMPGFYWTLGLAFKVFGYSMVTARIPSLSGYLLSCVLTWWIARRLYGKPSAAMACALFAFFPLCLVFAFTAMAEMVVVAAGLVAVAIWLCVLQRPGASSSSRVMGQPEVWVGALAIAFPLFFRETGVVVGVIMLAIAMGTVREKRWQVATVTGLVMLVVITAVMVSPVATGRPSLWKANILAGGDPKVLYADAYAAEQLPAGSLDWAQALGRNFVDNARNLMWTTEDADGWVERTAIWFLLSGIPLGVILSWRQRDWFAGGVAAATTILLIADLSCYDIWGYRGVRALLIMEPFVAMLWARVFVRWFRRDLWERAIPVVFIAIAGVLGTVMIWRAQREVDAGTLQDLAFMESIAPENGKLLVSPFEISLGYVNAHYPMRWAYPPSDCRSLRLLDEREQVGTMVMQDGDDTTEMLEGCGLPLRRDANREYRGATYRILRR